MTTEQLSANLLITTVRKISFSFGLRLTTLIYHYEAMIICKIKMLQRFILHITMAELQVRSGAQRSQVPKGPKKTLQKF